MADSPAGTPVLSAAETSAAESLLAEALGKPVTVRSAETIWGRRTTIVRPRVLTWLGSFIDAAARADELPRLRSLAEALRSLLRDRWPSAVAPSYPALASPGEPLARVPRRWESSD